ncbi:MAG: hypothetical protein IPL46_21025 [Saprospiraceae bacterium]|nr:hypothetical protein [Saprospiraceae bacterium]
MKIIALRKVVSISVLLTLLFSFDLSGQITVMTFLDLNNNGVQDEEEELVTGLTVTATDANGNEILLLDDGHGTFTLPGELITTRLRVRVTGYAPGLLPGVACPTSVFYVQDGESVLVPVSTGPSYNIVTSRILIPCYDGGPAEGKATPAFVSFPYGVDGIAQSKGGSETDPEIDATTEQIGSTWGWLTKIRIKGLLLPRS